MFFSCVYFPVKNVGDKRTFQSERLVVSRSICKQNIMRTIVSCFLKHIECFRAEFYKNVRKTILITNIPIHVNHVHRDAATSCHEIFLSPFYTLSPGESPGSLRAATSLEEYQHVSHTPPSVFRLFHCKQLWS